MRPSSISIYNNRCLHRYFRLCLVLALCLPCAVVTTDSDMARCDAFALEDQKIRDDVIPKVCRDFTRGHDLEFTSPGYPRLYPNNTVCYKTITAPFGHVIRLEFREHFYMEPSPNCEYDFLEIRDGIRGYAKLIGKYCGNTYPPDITSSDRYLWLRFTSDDTIQYGGFRVVYKYIKSNGYDHPDLQPCTFQMCGVEGRFGTLNIPPERYNYSLTYGVPINCLWEISVQVGWKIYLNFETYYLGKPNECDVNFIDIFYDSLESTTVQAHFCGSVAESKWSTGNKMHLLYYEDVKALRSENKVGVFSVNFTAFRTTGKDEKCNKATEFDCEDSTCIDLSLRCNDLWNCKYQTDEDLCKVLQISLFGHRRVQIILIIGLALLLSILVPSCLNFYRKLKKNGGDEESSGGIEHASSVQGSMGQRTIEGSLHEGPNALSCSNKGLRVEEEDEGCYVPEVDLSIFLKRSNGGHSVSMQDSPPISGEETPLDCTLPTNFDSADPLITTTPTNGCPPFLSHVAPLMPQILHKKNNYQRAPNYNDLPSRTSTPPPPPPPIYYNGNSGPPPPDADYNNPLFMPPPPTLEEVEESDAIFGLPPSNLSSGRPPLENPNRPRSFESTKSAPDVIGRI